MDRLEMAIELIKEAQRERDRLEEFNREYEKALEKDVAGDSPSCRHRWAVEDKFSPIPKKSVINSYIKMARRILAGEYMK